MKTRIWPVLLVAAMGFCALSAAVQAADTAAAPVAGQMTESAVKADGPLRLNLDTTKVIKLDRDAASVVVTNPNNVRVLLDTPRLLLVMPRTPGSTSMMVLDAKGETILEKTVIVDAGAKSQYVRIRRMCGQAGTGPDCVPTSYFYCPDGCYEVSPMNPAADGGEIPPQTGGGTATSGAFAGAQASDLQPPPGAQQSAPPPEAQAAPESNIPEPK